MRKFVVFVILCALLASVAGCSTAASTTEPTVTTEETMPTDQNAGYKTEADWALYDENYMFAVEVSGYEGDIFEAGEYVFEVVSAQSGFEGVYDVYIESETYNSLSELGDSDYTIGGQGGMPIKIDLKAGQYVYVVPYPGLVYEPTGYLSIKKQ